MATKITILGEEPAEKKKKIEVKMMLHANGSTSKSNINLSEFKDIKIIKVCEFDNFDCIVFSEDNELVYLAKFNDGIV